MIFCMLTGVCKLPLRRRPCQKQQQQRGGNGSSEEGGRRQVPSGLVLFSQPLFGLPWGCDSEQQHNNNKQSIGERGAIPISSLLRTNALFTRRSWKKMNERKEIPATREGDREKESFDDEFRENYVTEEWFIQFNAGQIHH